MHDPEITLEKINHWRQNTMVEHLGIELTELGPDYLCGKMPVDHRTHQPMGLLHGGASVALAETLGSIAAQLQVDQSKYACVGLEINANHIRAVRSGIVTATGTVLHRGKTTMVWDIKIVDEQQRLVCVSRCTIAIIKKS